MIRTAFVVLAALVLTGCTERSDSTLTPATHAASPGTSLIGKSFEAVEVTEDGARRPLVRGTTLEVRFGADGSVEMEAGCNRLSAPVTIGRSRLDVGQIIQTDKGCRGVLHAQDDWLADFFGGDPSWRPEDTEVVLERGTTTIRLAVPPPVRPEAIVGRKWVIYGLIDSGTEGGIQPGFQPDLNFDGSYVTGDTSCAQLRAPASVGAGTIELGTVRLTSVRPCPSGGDAIHTAIMGVLGGGATLTVTLEDRTLRLMSGDKGLLLKPR
ncbi:META domain-containing protein [Cryptosporangium minutisporangium]|uniref:DUF306 domain-containing protein n=1 Tax=Cryptosporangium minutisporangium TaxID=113569 RepID=A0ABP6SPY9_9ACTN